MKLDYSNRNLRSIKDIPVYKDETVTKLDISGNKITSLEGLKRFPNLISLNCSSNRLTTLKGIENCKKLESLKCERNSLTKLLDLSGLNTLKKINCATNQLVSIRGIENSPGLEEFCVPFNPVSSKNIAKIVNSLLLYPKILAY